MFRKLSVLVVLAIFAGAAGAAGAATFDDLSLAPESYWNGSDGSGGFTSGSFYFNNNYDPFFCSWDGWAYSNMTDTTTPGFANQYSAYTGGGVNGSANYGVAYCSSWASTPPTATYSTIEPSVINGAYFTNTTYAALSMLYGDDFAKKFGGDTGDDPDWFLLTIEGKDLAGQSTGTADFYLADYRFADNSQDYILDEWAWVDLTSLGAVGSLEYSLTSSDVGAWGMNTPAYFAMDDLSAVPEPMTLVLFGTGLAAVAGLRYRKRHCR